MDQDRLDAERAALEDCENDPIHEIGAVQDFGWLLACDRSVTRVTYVSTNVERYTEWTVDDLLGRPIGDALDSDLVHTIRNAAGHSTADCIREHIASRPVGGSSSRFDVTLHVVDDATVVEFVPMPDGDAGMLQPLTDVQRMFEHLGEVSDLDQLAEFAVEEIRAVTGYDRVMLYRFLPDQAGEVVAESRADGIDSFLGLRYPAYDIPRQARELYRRTPLRIITSIAGHQPPIRAADPDAPPLDLSMTVLRAAAEVHRIYLTNMGVGASMSIPVLVGDRLWGLFALHHYAERVPTPQLTVACELIGRMLSLTIRDLRQQALAEKQVECLRIASSMFLPDESPLGVALYWDSTKADLQQLIPCDGVALVGQERVDSHGSTPADDAVLLLVERARARSGDAPTAYESLLEALDGNAAFDDLGGGALVVPSQVPQFGTVVFFRDPAPDHVRWAGAPTKEIEATDDGFRLHPRASFAEYLEDIGTRCSPWTTDDTLVAEALQDAFDRVHRATAGVAEQRERLGLMVRELNHRVRNLLALVWSLVNQTKDGTASIDEYVDALQLRISALAEAHTLLSRADWQAIELSTLVQRTIGHYRFGAPGRVRIEGPAVLVPPELASLLALVFHEMASNAAKYGALSISGGRIDVSWTGDDDELVLRWVESGGPPVRPPTRRGFGTSIINDAVPYEFGGSTEVDFDPAGVRATIHLPASALGIDVAAVGETAVTESSADRTRRRILIVEDDFLIGRQMAELVGTLTDAVTVTAPTVERGLAALDEHDIGAALLDANLKGEFSGPIARRLDAAGIPFAFLTGYGSTDQAFAAFPDAKVLRKPVPQPELRTLLTELGVMDD